jgi:hypothetical protein
MPKRNSASRDQASIGTADEIGKGGLMHSSGQKRCRLIRPAGIGLAVLLGAGSIGGLPADARTLTVAPLAANDVSWLFPAPAKSEDLTALISIADVTSADKQDPTKRDPVLTDAVFQRFLAIADGDPGSVAGTSNRIGLPQEARSIGAWKIAGIRIDAGAPGLAAKVRAQFGQGPQIRLILQPVIQNADGSAKALDLAAHLIFSVAQEAPDAPAGNGCFQRSKPDVAALKAVVAELAELRGKLANGQLGLAKVMTSGVPLGVHPGLKNPATADQVRQEMKSFLERHISADQLGAMAVMGLPEGKPAPWIFLSMLNVAQLGGFVPVHGPTLDGQEFAQSLNPVGTAPRVVPAPHANNLAPITCQNAALPKPLPVAGRRGETTADILDGPALSNAKTKSILDLIADPARSHFFNTDCVSCHTETRLRMDKLHVVSIAGIDQSVLPNGAWDVRNFGWAPPGKAAPAGTVAERTATETAAVVKFINAGLLPKK